MPALPPVIVDTNVLVSGLLTQRADSPVAVILDGLKDANFPFVLSDALLAEYREVLLRPHLRRQHGLTAAEVDVLLTDIARHAIVLSTVRGPAAPDAGDQHLWNLLATRDDLLLVTGDQQLLDDPVMKDRVILPLDFLARLTRA